MDPHTLFLGFYSSQILPLQNVFANLFPPGCVCHVLQRHSKSRLTCQSVEKEDDTQERSGREAGGQFNR